MERTFCIIKPDAVARNLQGEILAMIQAAGLRVVAMKQIRMPRRQAEGFYTVHPRQCGGGHHPQEVRRKHRSQLRARL